MIENFNKHQKLTILSRPIVQPLPKAAESKIGNKDSGNFRPCSQLMIDSPIGIN